MFAMKLRSLAGDVYGVDLVALPSDRNAAESLIRATYRTDVLNRVRLTDAEADSYAARHTIRAMECLDRATASGVCSYPIERMYESDPVSYHEIQAEDGSSAKMVL